MQSLTLDPILVHTVFNLSGSQMPGLESSLTTFGLEFQTQFFAHIFQRVLTQKANRHCVAECFTHLLLIVTNYTVVLYFPPHIWSGLSSLDIEGISVSVINIKTF